MNQISHQVRTRMAPSPTGELHVGSLAILLKDYAYAKKHHGQFILRIEDTDQERLVPGAIDRIQQVIQAYGLDWDEGPSKPGPVGPYIQSQRLEIYRQQVETLINNGKAYYCFCSHERLEVVRESQRAAHLPPRYDRHCRQLSLAEAKARVANGESYVVRLAVPDGQTITFNDLIRGDITFQSDEVDDQVLLKSDGFPTYHLAVVVDDYLMKISHIIRGEEWISSTPKHILLYQAFGWEMPVYAHMPLFLNPDGKGKMSKRKGTVSAQSFLDAGYLPAAMLNFLMILGWTPADQREILNLAEYVQEFDLKDMNAKSVVFDLKKLAWLNGIYLRQLSLTELAAKIKPFLPADFPVAQLEMILPLVAQRLVTLADIEKLTAFFYRPIQAKPELLLKKSSATEVKSQLALTIETLTQIDDWSIDQLEKQIRELQATHQWQKSQYFMLLRVAITGETATPPLFETMTVLTKQVTLDRLTAAIKQVTD